MEFQTVYDSRITHSKRGTTSIFRQKVPPLLLIGLPENFADRARTSVTEVRGFCPETCH